MLLTLRGATGIIVPNTAPATQNNSHAWSSSHLVTHETSFTMRGATGVTLQPHQILHLSRKMTLPNLKENVRKLVKHHVILGRSEHDPRMKPSVRSAPRNRAYFSGSPRAFSAEKCNVSTPGYYSKIHQVLHLPWKVALELHQMLHLPRKVALELHQMLRKGDTWTSPNAAPATKSHTWAFPNAAPATKRWRLTFPKCCTILHRDTWPSRISCLTNFLLDESITYESLTRRIYYLTHLSPDESIP